MDQSPNPYRAPDSRGAVALEARRPSPQAVLVLLMALAALCHFNRVSISVAGSERLMGEFALSAAQLGAVYSSYLVVYTLLMIPGGWLLDRFGPTRTLGAMVAGSVVFVAATALVGLSALPGGALGSLIVVRGALGAVSVPMHPGAANMVANWFGPAQRAAANGFVTAAALVGIALTYPLFGMLIDTVGWRAGMLISAAVTGLVAVAGLVVARDRPDCEAPASTLDSSLGSFKTSTEPMSGATASSSSSAVSHAALLGKPAVAPTPGFETAFKDKASTPPLDPAASGAEVPTSPATEPQVLSLMLLTASYAAVGYFQYLFFYWSQYYFEHVLDLDARRARFGAMILSLAMAAGMLAGGWLAARLQARWHVWRGLKVVPIIGMAGGALVTVVGVLVDWPAVTIASFALAMAAVGMAEGPFWTAVVEVAPRRRGTAAALFNTGGNVGGLLAPYATPVISAWLGWQSGIALASGFCLIGALLWLWVRPANGTPGT
ncbi:MAG: MFS transporter [Pirellulales bacterium]|nr:MFS transporter [Pirellulales bacterium]